MYTAICQIRGEINCFVRFMQTLNSKLAGWLQKITKRRDNKNNRLKETKKNSHKPAKKNKKKPKTILETPKLVQGRPKIRDLSKSINDYSSAFEKFVVHLTCRYTLNFCIRSEISNENTARFARTLVQYTQVRIRRLNNFSPGDLFRDFTPTEIGRCI